jgi:hypothetical protein
MIKTEHFGYGKNGQLTAVNKNRLAEDLRQFPDCDITLTIKRRGKRSIPQNSYYHAVIVREVRVALNERGNRMDDELTHEFLKLHFNKQYIRDESGEIIGEFGGSTTELSKDEFIIYIDTIKEWASEKLGIYIPEANTQTELFKVA